MSKKLCVANLVDRCWFRLKSACCTLVQEQVLEPQPRVVEPKVKDWLKMSYSSLSDYRLESDESIVTFIDSDVSAGTGATAGNHAFSNVDATTETGLEDWLKRPVRLQTYSWTEAQTFGTALGSITPWSVLMSTPAVANKLNNYSWFRGDLKLKFQITASPFYYGLVKFNYQPLQNFKPTTIVVDASSRDLILRSQRPHVDIVAGVTDSVEMTIPFIYPANYVNLQSSAAIAALGQLEGYVYSQLQSANGVTGTGLTITLYGWLENVQLSGASVGYALQSDEYGEGPVSRPASWVANAATYFENIPVIGPFATATKIGAGAISAIASLFGFTNVPVIEDTSPMRNEPFPKMATSEIGYPVEKLTLDPKNELSVDPTIVGLPSGVDEMSISYLSQRETYLARIAWTTADTTDTLLMYSRVNPKMFDINQATNSIVYQAPMSMVSSSFVDWRGSIIFRFHIVASKYHKGKVLISFDPTGYSGTNIGNTTGTTNVVHSVIVDIGETNDIEFEVPYQQATQFLSLRGTYIGNVNYSIRATYPGTTIVNPLYDNGLITMRVLTPLTAPILSSSLDILMYVRAGKDIEFANPASVDDTTGLISFYAPQCGEYVLQSEELTEEETAIHKVVLAPTMTLPQKQYLVHYGENIRSLRQLMRRYEFVGADAFILPTTGNGGRFAKNYYKMPAAPGYAALATTNASKIVGTGTAGFNFTAMTLLQWFSNAFLAYRGSVHWSHNVDSPGLISNLRVYKDPYTGGAITCAALSFAVSRDKICSNNYTKNWGTAGQAVTNQHTQAGLNVSAPNYSKYKFQSTNPANANLGVTADGSISDMFVVQGDFSNYNTYSVAPFGTIYSYAAAGTDFGMYYFLNCPTIYVYGSYPSAP